MKKPCRSEEKNLRAVSATYCCSYVFVRRRCIKPTSFSYEKIYLSLAIACICLALAIEKRIVCATFYAMLLRKCEKCGAGMENSHGNRAFPSMILEVIQAVDTKLVASPSSTSMKISSTRLAMAHRAN
jgi:uncharacterized membrane protein YfbV (UPF0208 family)